MTILWPWVRIYLCITQTMASVCAPFLHLLADVIASLAAHTFEYDGPMPKVDSASSLQEFMLGDSFQTEFNAWKAKVEAEESGRLEIVHEEVVQNDSKIIIFWRVVPRPTTTGTRGRGR